MRISWFYGALNTRQSEYHDFRGIKFSFVNRHNILLSYMKASEKTKFIYHNIAELLFIKNLRKHQPANLINTKKKLCQYRWK